jgi:hypothetical protein
MIELDYNRVGTISDNRFIRDIFGVGSLDIGFIKKYYVVVDGLVDFENLAEYTLAQLDANVIIYELFACINNLVFKRAAESFENDYDALTNNQRKTLIKKCHDRLECFEPFINCIDSWFQNELDQIDIQERSIEEITDDLCDYMIVNCLD